MRSMLFRLFLALVTFTMSVAAQGRPGVATQAPTGPIYLTHVTLIDTVAGRELPDRTVVISGDRISEVTGSNRKKVPSDAQVLEGKGKYLIPGLWDMHVHALFAAWPTLRCRRAPSGRTPETLAAQFSCNHHAGTGLGHGRFAKGGWF